MNGDERGEWGSRYLTDESDLFNYNCWDNAKLDESIVKEYEKILNTTYEFSLETCRKKKLPRESLGENQESWDKFHDRHKGKEGGGTFFKERNWLLREMPELFKANSILEIGCGSGASVIPLVRDTNSKIIAFDISRNSLDNLKNHSEFDPERVSCFYYDVCEEDNRLTVCETAGVQESSIEYGLALFVLGAIRPSKIPTAIGRLREALMEGGLLFVRDYGYMDLAMMRFHKKGRLVSEIPNTYLRGDGTIQHFFVEEEFRKIFEDACFECVDFHKINRLIVNRKKKLRMYRIWFHGVFRKSSSSLKVDHSLETE